MTGDQLEWNGGLQLGSETVVLHRTTGDSVVITVLEGDLFSTQGLCEDCNDHARLTEAELADFLKGCDPSPIGNVEDFPFRPEEPQSALVDEKPDFSKLTAFFEKFRMERGLVPNEPKPLRRLPNGDLAPMLDFGYVDESEGLVLCVQDQLPWRREGVTPEEAEELHRKYAFPPLRN